MWVEVRQGRATAPKMQTGGPVNFSDVIASAVGFPIVKIHNVVLTKIHEPVMVPSPDDPDADEPGAILFDVQYSVGESKDAAFLFCQVRVLMP